MKNTPIPLDMIFIGRDRKIVGIVARRCRFHSTRAPLTRQSQYVLEINGGLAERHGIKTGDRVRFDSIPTQGGRNKKGTQRARLWIPGTTRRCAFRSR